MARGRPSKRQVIINTVLKLFAQRGYQGTSIDLVVQEAGVSKPTVYNNFPSKLALLSAVVEQHTAALIQQFEQAEEIGGVWYETLTSFYTDLAEDADRLALYRIFLGEDHKLSPELRAAFAHYQSQVDRWTMALLPAAIAKAPMAKLLVQGTLMQGIVVPHLLGETVCMSSVRQALIHCNTSLQIS